MSGLLKDFYTSSNIMAVGEPKTKSYGDGGVLFMCPIVLPVGGFVGRTVKKTIAKGFKSSFAKKGIVVKVVKQNKRVEGYFDNV